MARISPLAAHGARIKELYVELANYGFFHGPSEVDRIDRRFTGRSEVLARLKSLLTDHESLAGAYLVTGFRGAGKSSLVAKALSEITPGRWGAIGARRILRIASPVLCSALIHPDSWPNLATAVAALLGFLVLVGLIATDPDRYDRIPDGRRKWFREWWRSARRMLFLRSESPKASRFRTLVRDILAILVLVVFSRVLFDLLAHDHISLNLAPHRLLVVGALVLFYTGILPVLVALRSVGPGASLDPFWARLRRSLAAGGRIQVKVNLSQDNLREIDILRSIASSLENEYRRFSQLSFWRLFIRFLLVLPFLLIALFLYETMLDHWVQDVKTDLHIACLFPSQARYAVSKERSNQLYWEALNEHRESLYVGSADFRWLLHQTMLDELGTAAHGPIHNASNTIFGQLYESVFLITTDLDTLVQIVVGKVARDGMLLFVGPDDRSYVFDYGMLVFLLLGWILPAQLLRFSLLDRPSHRDIVRQLNELNEMIDSEVTHEKGGVPLQATTLLSLSFGPRRKQTFRHLNEREIEKRLIEILRHSQRISPLEIRPEFIVVFDELDKIQHTPVERTASPLANGEDSAHEPVRATQLGPIEVVERNRQHRILSLVSNLKHFLSTAPAKFIFIAGREMFDAALADVSDRHFFMGSVFNEVLHVPSFHSDGSDNRLPDITSLPEEVLCRFLLPTNYVGRPSLAAYRRYLEKELLPEESCSKELLDQQRNKVMYELHNFVTYLTYRSNGAPKRITAMLERFIVRLPERVQSAFGDATDEHLQVVGRSNGSLYLRFRYSDQYTFGLVTFLASPLIFSVNRAIKDYGDKILVSSSFVLDHIFKFHGHGFSWRNLELLPEVVDINRAPQLRELISHIMRFLSRGHINEIISGLYHFKFTRRISEEINLLSKLSEHESAAFNFTLDESLNLKRRFYRQLNRLLETHARYPESWGNHTEFVNSVAFLRMILGDLHYYDGEYDSAITEYMEAVQQLRQLELDGRGELLVLMIRNFLKLGLAFERKKTFDSAMVTYGRIASIAASFCQERSEQARQPLSRSQDSVRRRDDSVAVEGIRLIYQPMFARLQLIEKATLGGISESDLQQVDSEFASLLEIEQRNERFLATSEYHNKVGDILFFKNGPMPKNESVYCQRLKRGGSKALVERGRAEPEGLLASLRRRIGVAPGKVAQEERREETRRVSKATIQLGFENPYRDSLIAERRRLPCRACGHYNEALLTLCESYLEVTRERLAQGPGEVLVALLESFERAGKEAAARPFADRKNFLHELGDVLSDLGNTYISCAFAARSEATAYLPRQALSTLAELLREDREDGSKRSKDIANLVTMMKESGAASYVKLLEALAYFAASAIVFRDAANHRAASMQIIKLLWVLREYLALVRPPDPLWQISDIETLTRLCIRELHRSHEGTHRLEIESIKEVLQTRFDARARDEVQVDLSRLSINANITEALVLLHEIKTRLPLHGPQALLALEGDICSPYAMFPSVYSRIHALRLRSSMHWKNLRLVGLDLGLDMFKETRSDVARLAVLKDRVRTIDEAIEVLGQEASKIVPLATELEGPTAGIDLLEMVLIDAAYCNHEIIRLMQIYGRTYMASHSMKAAAHDALSTWCNRIFAYIRYRNAKVEVECERLKRDQSLKKKSRQKQCKRLGVHLKEALDDFQDSLERAIGIADMVHISPNYHRELALLNWKAAAETHTEGRAYKELLEDMFYLNDDFADFLEHFCAALERLRLNSGSIDNRIRETTRELSKTSIYGPEHYFARRPTRSESSRS